MTQKIGISLDWQRVTSNQADACTLSSNELHLWWLPLVLDTAQSDIILNLLSDAQRDKYHRRNNVVQKQAYLAGRYHLLRLLGVYNQCKPSEVLLSYSRLNKPYLNPNPRELQFNFSDTFYDSTNTSRLVASDSNTTDAAVNTSLHMGLFAFCLKHEVGVDVESVHRVSDFEKIAKRRYTTAEQAFIQDQDGQIDPKKALAIWTRKEAYGKATGQGINFTMREHELVNGKQPSLNFKDKNDNWRLTQLEISDTHIASVVHQSHTPLEIKGFKNV